MLLRNEGDLLPLDPTRLASVAVVGALADSKRDTLGPWVFDFDLDETVTVFEGLQGRLGGSTEVRYAPGIRPAQRSSRRCSTCFPATHPPTPRTSTTKRNCSGQSTWPAPPTWPSWCSVSGSR